MEIVETSDQLAKLAHSQETNEDGSVKIISYKETLNAEKSYNFSVGDAKAFAFIIHLLQNLVSEKSTAKDTYAAIQNHFSNKG